MTKTSTPPSPTDSGKNHTAITSLNPYDVLSGRGTGQNEYIGNQRFRDLIDSRRKEYREAPKQDRKKEIAEEVYQAIRSKGGRFLHLSSRAKKPESFLVEQGEWIESEKGAAIEKCKQALRQQHKPRKRTKKKKNNVQENNNATRDSHDAALFEQELNQGQPALMPVLPPMLIESGLPTSADARLLLYQRGQMMMAPSTFPSYYRLPPGYGTIPMSTQAPDIQNHGHNVEYGQSHALVRTLPIESAQTSASVEHVSSSAVASASDAMNSSSEWATAEEMSDFLLASIGWDSKHPRFTEEMEALERANMTEEERTAALADKFGRFCNVSDHRSKRPRKDLDEPSIDFLIMQMKEEIEWIPEDKKKAMLEARKKCQCREEEFSDARLKQFLGCEGNNPKFAAQRFVNYWNARREVFGPEKYLLRMSLSEAASDDVAALEAGVYRLLPLPDLSGRPILYLDPSLNTGGGYTQESLIRSMWYMIEVAASGLLGGKTSDYIFIGWHYKTTVWDLSAEFVQKLIYYEKSCFPIKAAATHVCCLPNFVIRILKPLAWACMDTRGRSRVAIHDVPENEIVEALSNYGIEKHVLPTEMGGSFEFNPSEWIANRRATEMEEL